MSSRPCRATAWLDDPLPGVVAADVQLQGRPVDLVGHGRQVLPCRRDVDEDDVGPVAAQGPGNRRADARGRHRSRRRPCRPAASPRRRAVRPAPELTVRNCPSTNADRPERKNRNAPRCSRDGGPGAVREQDAVAGGAGAQFLRHRPQETVHAAAGPPPSPAPAPSRRAGHGDDAGVRRQVPQRGAQRSAPALQVARGGPARPAPG